MPDEQTDLIELIKTQIQVWRYEDWQVNSAEFIDKWQHIDRNLFQKNLLIDPCGVSEAGQQNAIKARCYEIAWQATEMLDVIIDPRRGGNVRVPIARMELTNQESARAIFYAFGLGEFAILIQHCHIPKRTKWVSI